MHFSPFSQPERYLALRSHVLCKLSKSTKVLVGEFMAEQSDTSTSLEILIPVSQFAPQFYMTAKPTFKRAPE
jgi:hypothetical protein